MTSERWQRIRVIFAAASALSGDERDGYLLRECGQDADLRIEVEKLLEAADSSDGFMSQPAIREVAGVIAADNDALLSQGQRIGAYEIVGLAGQGGMGAVYVAIDTRLDRKVAVKLLGSHVTEDKNRVSRFRREAFATSALNHPNIVTIYEIGEWQGRDLIVAEYVEGMTLRERIKKLSLGEALDIAAQIANGLAAAHDAAIIHRDIKPENIIIRPDGLVKILDFGIAKYAGAPDRHAAQLVETEVGEVIGTAAYMSPEQARGLDIDERTDIWSLGVILYEMLTGKLPFGGATRSDRIAAILEREPLPIGKLRRGVPAELERIVDRALCKDRRQRFRKMSDLAADLDGVRSTSGIPKRSGFSIPAVSHSARFARSYVVAGVLVLILASGALWAYLSGAFFTTEPSLTLQSMKITRLTDTSQASEVAISPDGEYVVFVKDEAGRVSLWLRQTSATSSVQIAAAVEGVQYASPAFSPDGRHVYYLKMVAGSRRNTLFQIPKLGGSEVKLVGDISFQDSGSSFSISPDGRQVAFIRLDEGFNRSLVVTDLDGGNERKLLSRSLPEFLTGAAWSPNGGSIAVFAGAFGSGLMRLVLVDLSDGVERPIADQKWVGANGLTWLNDGSGLIISAAEKPGSSQLWHVSYPRGQVSRITNDLSDYAAPSIAAGRSTVAAVQTNENPNIWVRSMENGRSTDKQLTFGNGGGDGARGIAWMPDRSIVYISHATGNTELWHVSADGSSNKQLTALGSTIAFHDVSPDGRYIVFFSDRSGEPGVWRIDHDGSNLIQLTLGAGPSVSADGWVYFYRVGSPWKIPIEGGEAVPVPIPEADKATMPVASHDGTMLACNYLRGGPDAQFRIGIISSKGGQPIKIFPTFSYAVKSLEWIPGTKDVSFLNTQNGVTNLFRHSLSSDTASPVTDFTSDIIWNFAWSSDGKKLALARGTITKDVVLISDFK